MAKKIEKEEEIIQIDEIKNTIKKKNKIPKEEMKKINKTLFMNIIIALGIIVYFVFLILGKINIQPDSYTTDLKVFSVFTLLIAIIITELAYKKDSGKIALYGVEMIILSIITLALIYINLIFSTKYIYIVLAISYIFAIYYVIKSTIIYVRSKKQYFINNMKEIINKDE